MTKTIKLTQLTQMIKSSESYGRLISPQESDEWKISSLCGPHNRTNRAELGHYPARTMFRYDGRMIDREIQVGSTITNGSSAIRVTERIEHSARWKAAGWLGLSIALEEFGGMTGYSTFVPDYLLGSWRHVPFEWIPVAGGTVEERYVWSSDWSRLVREVRRA